MAAVTSVVHFSTVIFVIVLGFAGTSLVCVCFCFCCCFLSWDLRVFVVSFLIW